MFHSFIKFEIIRTIVQKNKQTRFKHLINFKPQNQNIIVLKKI